MGLSVGIVQSISPVVLCSKRKKMTKQKDEKIKLISGICVGMMVSNDDGVDDVASRCEGVF